MSNIRTEVGRRIRNYRINRRMSQEELAERCGLHPTYIGQLERGEKNATIESIAKVAGGLEVPLSRLFENIDDNLPDLPRRAYNILQSVSADEQEILLQLLETACKLKNFKQY